MPRDRCAPLRIDASLISDRIVLRMVGVLDATTYRDVRDAIVKCAIDGPAAVVIDVSGLQVPSPSAWSVFTSASWLIKQWPDVPIALVCGDLAGRRVITRNGIVRYLPLYGSVAAVVDALDRHVVPIRRRVRQRWTATTSTVPLARSFVSHWLQVWSMGEFTAAACVVTTILVDNVLQHTTCDPDLRLESDGVTVTIAVADDSQLTAGLLETAETGHPLTELHMIAALTRVWGNTPLTDGKVVWAVLGPENRL